MIQRVLLPSALALALLGLAACTSSASSTGSGLDRSKRLADLPVDERKTLCDWTVSLYGGYGASKAVTCNGAPAQAQAFKDQALCVDSLVRESCTATVADAEDCARSRVQSGDVCTGGVPTSCDRVFQCASVIDGGPS